MNALIDKLIIFIICFALYVPNINNKYMVVPILIVLFLTSLLSYKENKRALISIFLIFLFLCIWQWAFIFFLPVICYDLFFYKVKWLWLLSLFPILIDLNVIPAFSKVSIVTYIFLSYILKYRTISLENIKKSYYSASDNAKELTMKFESKNRDLLEKQDYEINLATLRERNRIARDIHDNVGHLLSRCILQIGALLAINKDKNVNDNLSLIKETLSEAMTSIRSSVHDLHEEAIDLQIEVQKLVDSFKFCSIKFNYDVESSPEKNIKYCFITIIKESLSNIIKHSNATDVLISIREHPALYQLVIKDNGNSGKYLSEKGIGIKNISDRVSALGGNLNINDDNGFRIFISIPK